MSYMSLYQVVPKRTRQAPYCPPPLLIRHRRASGLPSHTPFVEPCSDPALACLELCLRSPCIDSLFPVSSSTISGALAGLWQLL